MSEVLQIISLLANLLFGTGFIVTIVTLRQTRRKATTDVEKGSVELVGATVNTMIESVNSLMEQNKHLQEQIQNKQVDNEKLQQQVTRLDQKLSCLIRTNREVIKLLEKIGTDEHIINMLKEETR